MTNKLKEAFSSVHATQQMKNAAIKATHNGIRGRQMSQMQPRWGNKGVVVAIATILVVVCLGYAAHTSPVSYISIDINPSFELSLNVFDRVVKAEAYNEEGGSILQNLNLQNKPYTQAIELLLADDGFVKYMEIDSQLSFTVVSKNEKSLLEGIQGCHGYSDTQAQCHSVDSSEITAAHSQGFSLGKYRAFLELSKYDSSITADECRKMSMHEIQMRIESCNSIYSDSDNENYSDNDSEEKNSSDATSNGHHNHSECRGKGHKDGNGHR